MSKNSNKKKILIDIGHPAHVHYFKNSIKELQEEGAEFLVIARDKEVTFKLLEKYNIPYISKGKAKKSLVAKFLDILWKDRLFIKQIKKFKPDVMLGISGVHIAHLGKLFNIPSLVIDDTEISNFNQLLYKYWATKIITPKSFRKDFGKNHKKVQSFLDLLYLHPKYYSPKPVWDVLNIKENEPYILLRFIAWNAYHDVGVSGLTDQEKIDLVASLQPYGKIFISSESELPNELKPYELKIEADKMHDVLYHAKMFWSESGTMSTEAAILGTPTVVLNPLAKVLGCFIDLQDDYQLLYYFDDKNKALEKFKELYKNPNLDTEWQKKSEDFLNKNVSFTDVLVEELKNLK